MSSDAALRIAPFRFDVTPPLGHALLGGLVMPAIACDDALEGMGYVLTGAGDPIVVCVLDWAGIMNEAHLAWRTALAEAAGTSPARVALHCVHQHNAPFVCETARAAAARAGLPEMYDRAFFQDCLQRACTALRAALPRAERVTHVAHGRAPVERVASNRRVARDAHGRVTAMRASSCTDPALIALPEGEIDPMLQTVAFYGESGRKLVSAHYYATHPMSYYRDGRVSSDFCGLARKRRQADEPGSVHLYFTGCAANVSAGKYNDGSPAARAALTGRVYSAIVRSEENLAPQPLTRVEWRTADVRPAPHGSLDVSRLERMIADSAQPETERLLCAYRLGWLRRTETGLPLVLSRLQLNDIAVLHLPAEMFVEYQLRAQALRSGAPVAVAAYADDGPWYIPTRDEYPAGGYEVSVAFCREDVEDLMMDAIRRLLA